MIATDFLASISIAVTVGIVAAFFVLIAPVLLVDGIIRLCSVIIRKITQKSYGYECSYCGYKAQSFAFKWTLYTHIAFHRCRKKPS